MLGELLAVQIYLGKMRRAVKLQKEALAAVLERYGECSPVAADAGIVLRLCIVQRHFPCRVREIDKRKASSPRAKPALHSRVNSQSLQKADHGVPPERNYFFILHGTRRYFNRKKIFNKITAASRTARRCDFTANYPPQASPDGEACGMGKNYCWLILLMTATASLTFRSVEPSGVSSAMSAQRNLYIATSLKDA